MSNDVHTNQSTNQNWLKDVELFDESDTIDGSAQIIELNWNFSCYWKSIKNIWSICHICWKSFYFLENVRIHLYHKCYLSLSIKFTLNFNVIPNKLWILCVLCQEQWNPLGCIFQWQQTWHQRLRNSMWQLSLIVCLRSNVIKHYLMAICLCQSKEPNEKQRRIEEKNKTVQPKEKK